MINFSVAKRQNPFKPEETKYYAQAQMSEHITLKKLAKHVSEHNSVFSVGTVMGVAVELVHCVRELLLEGKKVDLGDLGQFFVTLQSKGVPKATDFTAQQITGVNVQYTPGDEFDDMIQDAEFTMVSSRAAQQATLKAEKEGKTTVDISKKPSTSGDSPTEDEENGGTAGDGSDSGSTDNGSSSTDNGGSGSTDNGGSDNGGGSTDNSGDDNGDDDDVSLG